MNPSIGLVVFDKDGTLFEFEATWGAWIEAVVADLATPQRSAETLARAVGYNLASSCFDADAIAIAGTGDEVVDAWIGQLGASEATRIRDVAEEHEQSLPLVPCGDVTSVLQTLRGGDRTIAVATNDYERVAHAHLQAGGISALVDHVLGCDSGYSAKPEAGMLLAACELAGVEPHRAAMIGDSTRDLTAARNANFGLAVGVLTGPAARGELEPLADVVLDSIVDLPAWLAR